MSNFDVSYDTPIQIQQPKPDGTQIMVVGTAAQLNVDGTLTIGSHAPANATATGTVGTITYASGFVYVCVATNTWQRVAIATW